MAAPDLTIAPGEAHPGLAAGRIKRIHVDQLRIKSYIKTGEKLPCLTIQMATGPRKCRVLAVLDGEGNEVARLVESLDQPLACGARIWLETTNEVKVIA